jgi:hypothetical protein
MEAIYVHHLKYKWIDLNQNEHLSEFIKNDFFFKTTIQ